MHSLRLSLFLPEGLLAWQVLELQVGVSLRYILPTILAKGWLLLLVCRKLSLLRLLHLVLVLVESNFSAHTLTLLIDKLASSL